MRVGAQDIDIASIELIQRLLSLFINYYILLLYSNLSKGTRSFVLVPWMQQQCPVVRATKVSLYKPFHCRNISSTPAFGVYISHLVCNATASFKYQNFKLESCSPIYHCHGVKAERNLRLDLKLSIKTKSPC